MTLRNATALVEPRSLTSWAAIPLLFYAACVASFVLFSLWTNDQQLVYSLDDPYIHLELARHLSQGEHALNSGEFSSPASSPLWPMLLIPFWWTGGALWAPLFLNIGAGVLATMGLAAAAKRVLDDDALRREGIALVLAALVAGNVMTLTATGMEHTLQIALTIWFAVGLMDVEAGKAPPWWMLVAGIAMPLVRLENSGIALLGAAYLMWRGYQAASTALALLPGISLLVYCGWLFQHTGRWLPFSVLAKAHHRGGMIANIEHVTMLVPLVLSVWLVLSTRQRPLPRRALGLMGASAAIGHVVLGSESALNRYTAYMIVFVMLTAAWSKRETIRRVLKDRGNSAQAASGTRILVLVMLILASLNAKPLYSIFGFSQHIYRMQGQMRRIAVEVVKGPVAVNDIGFVSFNNPYYVLDLIGLSNQAALEHRRAGDGQGWMAPLARSHDVKAILIFRHWFDGLPAPWVHVATLHVAWSSYPKFDRDLWICAPTQRSAQVLRPQIETFRETLPEGVEITLTP